MDPRSDAELVRSVLAGDVEAFAPIVHRYRDRYARFAARMLGDRDDADDALQSAFVRAFRNLGACRDPERLHAWLYQIVINECRTLAARRAQREARVTREEDLVNQVAFAEDPDSAFTREDIERALARIVPEQREAFVLKHVEGLDYDAMAELTGAGVSALKMRVKRACERLRELLEGVPR